MMISRQEFMLRVQLDEATLTTWIEEEWLIPASATAAPEFSEVDVARAELIRDLKHDLDVNDAGIGVILNLVDQVHGLRRTLAELLEDMRGRSEDRQARGEPE